MTIHFTKMHGIGNDYVYLDGISDKSIRQRDDWSRLAVAMSDRHTGIGSDGLIILLAPEPDVAADLRMRMFNADGGEAEMCGNGVRCVAKFAHDHGLTTANPMRIQTEAGALLLEYTINSRGRVDEVTVDMGEPIVTPRDIPVELPRPRKGPIVDMPLKKYIPLQAPAAWMEDCELEMKMTCVSLGNPHVVIFCGLVEAVPLAVVGPFLERQNIFPNGINVHFVQVRSSEEVVMRTWERGSGITRACGTGACAVCVAGVLTERTNRRLLAHLPGGDLTLHWREDDNHVSMTGPAVEVFSGEWQG